MEYSLNLPPGCKQVFSNSEISNAIEILAGKLNSQLGDDTLLVLCVMQGGLIFSGHLIPKLRCMLEIDYIHVSRYHNKVSGSELLWKAYPHTSLKNRNVLILDDILDEGETLKSIIRYCREQGADRVESAVLLKKTHNRCVGHDSNGGELTGNIALTVEDKYVFGFGMDYKGSYRQLDAIYAIEE